VAQAARPAQCVRFRANAADLPLVRSASGMQYSSRRKSVETRMRHSVDYLYSLYDALISINVPNDKARAVVDAMERDMGTTLATKTDLENLRVATKADLENLRVATKADLQLLRQELKADTQSLRQEIKSDMQSLHREVKVDMQSLRQELTSQNLATRDELRDQIGSVRAEVAELRQDNALVRKDMEILATRIDVMPATMTVRLGSIMVVGIGILFAALKLTWPEV
jgi:hypothetical protein